MARWTGRGNGVSILNPPEGCLGPVNASTGAIIFLQARAGTRNRGQTLVALGLLPTGHLVSWQQIVDRLRCPQ